MPALTGRPKLFNVDTDALDTVLSCPLGTRAYDIDGNDYIYLKGVGSTAEGSWVTFDEDHVTSLLATNAIGRVGIAMAALSATTYFGWYQIYGKNIIAKAATIADGALLYVDSTDGQVDDDGGSEDFVAGAISRSAVGAGTETVELNYPWMCNAAID